MSWNIDDKYKITCTKGDSLSLEVHCYINDAESGKRYQYIPDKDAGEHFIFAVKQDKQDDRDLFAVDCTDGIVYVPPEATRDLELGKYIWQVSLNVPAKDYVCTFIENKVLILTTEVYTDYKVTRNLYPSVGGVKP